MRANGQSIARNTQICRKGKASTLRRPMQRTAWANAARCDD